MVEIENKIQTYESYKDSGVEWLGEIPEHWNVERGKWLFEKMDRPVREEDEIITCFRDGEVTLRSNRKTSGFTVALKEHGYQGIRKGDLVIHAMDAFAGAIGVSDSDGKSSPVYSVCTERIEGTVNQYYYSYLLRDLALNGIILALAKGIRERSTDFRFNDFGELLLMLPPLQEQTAIAQFLDDKTSKIDHAVSVKEKQIELLKERKQILIHKAVTRGLDDSVPLKDSGVEWIGEIPEHWDILPGFMVYKENKTKNDGMKENVVLSLSYGNIVIKPKEKLIGLVPESFETYQIVKPGDIIIRCMDLQNDKTSLRTGIAVNDGIITSAYLNLNIINNNVSAYVYNFLHALDTTKVLYKFGTGLRQNLSFGDFKHLRIPVPPRHEQEGIVNYIENITQKIENTISLSQQEIEKLKEYKSSLINSVVTGKVKVC